MHWHVSPLKQSRIQTRLRIRVWLRWQHPVTGAKASSVFRVMDALAATLAQRLNADSFGTLVERVQRLRVLNR